MTFNNATMRQKAVQMIDEISMSLSAMFPELDDDAIYLLSLDATATMFTGMQKRVTKKKVVGRGPSLPMVSNVPPMPIVKETKR